MCMFGFKIKINKKNILPFYILNSLQPNKCHININHGYTYTVINLLFLIRLV